MEDWFMADHVQALVSYSLHNVIDIWDEKWNLLTVVSLFIADNQADTCVIVRWV